MKNSNKYIARGFFSMDGDEGGKLSKGSIVSEEFIKKLITETGAVLEKDKNLNSINNWEYSFYRLYLANGSMAVLQDLKCEGMYNRNID